MAVTSIFRPELFDGQVFLITGGGTGIGRAIARELSSLGASVAICSRSMAHLEDTCASIKATGGQVLAQACDIRNEKQVNAQVEAALERFGRLDGLVDNAGGTFFSPDEVREGLQASRQIRPARRMATESEVAAAVVFLLSPAAAYISGSTLRLDGAGSLYRPLNFDIPDHQPWPAFEADY